MLRITALDDRSSHATLKVEGRIVRPETAALVAAVRVAQAGHPRVVLDLSGVAFVDRDAVAVLHALRADGVELGACSGFIAALMNGETS